MRLLIFSPATLSSAIGRVTQLVVQALATQGHEAVVVRSEDTSHLATPPHAFAARTVPWDEAGRVEVLAQAADAVVYQIGDNYQLHRGCLEWLPRLPGVICLHDYFVGNLFLGWSAQHASQARVVVRAWYGDAVAERYFMSRTSADLIEATHETAPLTEWVASMATGVVTHSSWGIQRVLDACPGPVHVVPLPYNASGLGHGPSSDLRAPADTFTVLSVGHINPDKRVAHVIRAIGNSELLRRRSRYRLVGRIEPAVARQLIALADKLNVELVVSGEVDEAALQQAIGQADVVCCLRLPALEAASASAIEAMLYGKAVVVLDTGFYGGLPDACVRKISPAQEVVDLQRELESLCTHQAARVALGKNAAEWAAATFSAGSYARSLAHVCTTAAKVAPSIEAGRYFAQILARWGASATGPAVSEAVAPLRIFQSDEQSPTGGSTGRSPLRRLVSLTACGLRGSRAARRAAERP
jgi:glycosyltransferase involved in cell wall biosynthesis